MDERDKVGERAPAPRHGWNVMQVGQVGWHVVQAVEGWTVTPLFGPEILSREGAPLAVAASPVANLEGGQGVADAPAEAAESALARLRADQDAMVGAVIEEAAALVRGYAQKMLAAVVYQYHSETLNRPMPIEFYEFIDVEHEDAKALGVQLSRDDKWAALSYTAQDEITDARIAVLTEALKPLAAAIRAMKGPTP